MKEIRLILSEDDYNYLKDFLIKRKAKKNILDNFLQAGDDYLERTATKRTATKKATQVRQDKVICKIKNAIQMLKFQNIEDISLYKISKEANISYNTAKKYQELINKLLSK